MNLWMHYHLQHICLSIRNNSPNSKWVLTKFCIYSFYWILLTKQHFGPNKNDFNYNLTESLKTFLESYINNEKAEKYYYTSSTPQQWKTVFRETHMQITAFWNVIPCDFVAVYKTTWQQNPEDSNLNNHHCQHLKSQIQMGIPTSGLLQTVTQLKKKL